MEAIGRKCISCNDLFTKGNKNYCNPCKNLWSNYRIRKPEYNKLCEEQDHKCKLCAKEKKLYVDHCHETGQIRGLLCKDCNSALGILGDNLAGLMKAVEYLSTNETTD